jgi:hypothetical protein
MTNVLATITNSELSAMLDCPKKWDFRYKQRLVTRRPRGKLDLGSAAHDAIEMFYKDPSVSVENLQAMSAANLERMFKDHIDNGGFAYDNAEKIEMMELLMSMVKVYVEYGRSNDDFKVISLEEEFNIPAINPYTGKVQDNLRVMGKIDGWCMEGSANLILEHKTAKDAPSADFWWKYLNQIDFYTYAMSRKHEVDFSGSYINIIVKKIPRIPKLLKKGGLSKSTNIVTTEEIFRSEIIRNGLDESEYKEVLDALSKRPNPFVVRKAVYRHPSDIRQIEETIWWALQRKLKSTFYAKNKSDQCSWKCAYKELCIDDTEEMRNGLYKVRDSEHSELSGDTDGIEV